MTLDRMSEDTVKGHFYFMPSPVGEGGPLAVDEE
jgi:hypothetical protein